MAHNANYLYEDVMYKLRNGAVESTRNGMVKTMQTPQLFTVHEPTERVLFNPQRKANPYFHLMECVWMLAGCDDVAFLLPFNKRMEEYAEENGKVQGAYGHRWRHHFGRDQIMWAIRELREDPETRQVVIGMYDPSQDYHKEWKDRPCNTQIYLRMVEGRLDMTVSNRSNDAVWGLVGANIVHMTTLQQYIAETLKVPVGKYHVMTNNLHIYQQHWDLMDNAATPNHYLLDDVSPARMLYPGEEPYDLLFECEMFVKYQEDYSYGSRWLKSTVLPMYQHYMCRKNGDYHSYDLSEVEATDWRLAAALWRQWHDNGDT